MTKLKTLTSLLLVVALLFSLTACGNTEDDASSFVERTNATDKPSADLNVDATSTQNTIPSESHDEDKQNVDSKDTNNNITQSADVKAPPDERTIINDLKENGINTFQLNYCSETLEVNSLDIVKRKTEKDIDIVYLFVVFKNEQYTVNANITLYYCFYTVGGWILDYHEITSHESFANKPYYSNESFVQLLCEDFDNGKIVSRDHGVNDEGNYYDNITFCGTLSYNFLTTNITGTHTMIFSNDMWYEEIVFDSVSHDWKNLCGTWKYVHENGDYVTLVINNISGVDEEQYSIDCAYQTSAWGWRDEWEGQSYGDCTSSLSRSKSSYCLEKVSLLGVEVELPKLKSIIFPVSVGSQDLGAGYQPRFPVDSISIDKNEGVVLTIVVVQKGREDEYISFSMTKNK